MRMPSWQPWRELSTLGLLVMELSWIVPWYRSLTPETNAVPPLKAFVVLGGVFLSVYLFNRFGNFLRLRLDIRRVGLALILIFSILLSLKTMLYTAQPLSLDELIVRPLKSFSDYATLIPIELFVILSVLFVSWRGLSLAQQSIEPQTVKRYFQLGIFMFLGFVFLNTIVTGETPGVLLYVFLFAGLLALGSARITSLRFLRGGGYVFDNRWFLGMVIAALSVTIFAVIAAELVNQGRVLERIGALVLSILILAAILVLSPMIYFLPLLAGLVPGASLRLQELGESLEILRSTLSGLADTLIGSLPAVALLDLALRLRPVLLWSIVLVIGLAVLISVSRWVFKDREGERDDYQSLYQKGDILRLLKSSLQKQLRQLVDGLGKKTRLRRDERSMAVQRVRRIYAQLIELCESLGKVRKSAQTPLEFLPNMVDLFPNNFHELDIITQAYVKVRYGELPETQQEIGAVERAWSQVLVLGQDKLRSAKLKGKSKT